MTYEATLHIPPWLDPFSDGSSTTASVVVEQNQLEAAGRRVLGEPLTAQRLITATRLGLHLGEGGEPRGGFSGWGCNLPSAVAVLMPSAEPASDAAEKRARRKYQERLLTSQAEWPDLAAMRDTAFLLCADHKPPEYGLPDQLYRQHKSEGLLPWDGVAPFLAKLTGAVSTTVIPAWIEAQPALREALATIFAETFKNTHDHAREDINGSNMPTSLRAVYARYYPIANVLSSIALLPKDSVTPVERYVRGFARRDVKPGVRVLEQPAISGFLELSILDSGPGMAARWLGRPVHDVDASEQLTAVLQCFGKGRTTTGAPGRGFGLWKVLASLIGLRGFISVRTNSIHAYRQFGYFPTIGQEETHGGQRVPKEQLYDWKRGFSTVQSMYPHVHGTVISFLLPMVQA